MAKASSVSAAAISVWLEEGERLGLDMPEFLPDCRTFYDMRRSPATIPLTMFVEVIEGIARQSGNRSLGWVLGDRYDLTQLGDVGRAILSSSTLGSALRRLVDYFGLMQDSTEMTMRSEDGHCSISYRILDPEIWPRHQDAIFTMAIICQLIRRARDIQWEQVELGVEQDDSTVSLDLGRCAATSCYSDGDANIIRFPLAYLNLPMTLDPAVVPPDFREMNRHVAQKRRATGIDMRVRALIYQQLGSGHIDQEYVAGQLGMSSRTLRRRLADVHFSFQQIVDDCRMRQAAHEFRLRGHVSIAQTALRLGYSEHSTFTRAFSRWSGMPPQMFIRKTDLLSSHATQAVG